MAKELDETTYIENTQCVTHIDGDYIQDKLNRTDAPHILIGHLCKKGEDNQRQTSCYYIYPDDALLGKC